MIEVTAAQLRALDADVYGTAVIVQSGENSGSIVCRTNQAGDDDYLFTLTEDGRKQQPTVGDANEVEAAARDRGLDPVPGALTDALARDLGLTS